MMKGTVLLTPAMDIVLAMIAVTTLKKVYVVTVVSIVVVVSSVIGIVKASCLAENVEVVAMTKVLMRILVRGMLTTMV